MFLSLVSSSSGNCSLVSDGSTSILVDCGLSLKKLEDELSCVGVNPRSLSAILITHEHSDHTKGAGAVSKKYGLPVFTTEETFFAMKNHGIPENNLNFITPNESFEIESVGIKSFSIPHDAKNPLGYSFFYGNQKLSLATDIGNMNDTVFENIKGSIAVILESNHDLDMLKNGKYPYLLKQRILGPRGHLSNVDAAKTVLKLVNSGTKHIMLGHLSKENNTPKLALLETANLLKENGIIAGKDFSLRVASPNFPTDFKVQKYEEETI